MEETEHSSLQITTALPGLEARPEVIFICIAFFFATYGTAPPLFSKLTEGYICLFSLFLQLTISRQVLEFSVSNVSLVHVHIYSLHANTQSDILVPIVGACVIRLIEVDGKVSEA